MTKASTLSAVAATVAISLLACNEEKAKPEPAPTATASTTAMAPSAMAPVAAPTAESVSGTVAETMDAGGYTYIRIATAAGDKWAAVPQTKLAVGDKVKVVNPMVMKSFASPTLKRTFDEILFGTLEGGPTAAPAATATPLASGSAKASAAPVSSGPITKAPGPAGRTIAEVFANKASLKDKPILVRGRVTKFNAGIMGKNWIHIVDGTGSKATNDNDLTVTTAQGEANVGDVILVRGVVHLDKDFGGGYSYAVIVEDATIEK